MIAFYICLAVVWLFVTVAFALLARFKYKLDTDIRIWPDVLASVSAFIVFVTYVVQIALEVTA